MSLRYTLTALACILEQRVRASRRGRRLARAALAFAARRSREARDLVRVRVRPIV